MQNMAGIEILGAIDVLDSHGEINSGKAVGEFGLDSPKTVREYFLPPDVRGLKSIAEVIAEVPMKSITAEDMMKALAIFLNFVTDNVGNNQARQDIIMIKQIACLKDGQVQRTMLENLFARFLFTYQNHQDQLRVTYKIGYNKVIAAFWKKAGYPYIELLDFVKPLPVKN